MLTVITGQPGAGKTSYVVEKFLMPLAAKEWKEPAITSDGEATTVTRRCFTNIKGLLLDHELIDKAELDTWHEWVKPGDLIVFDEVQKPWPLCGANVKQPMCITELETHRHYGIDMILLTQHPMLLNPALPRLAGQHLHVRRLGNSRFATVYEWDGVSKTLLYKNAFAKKPWRRGKAVEKTYRSSSLHTKQKRAIPTLMFGFAFALAAMAYLGPTAYGRITERVYPDRAKRDAERLAQAPTPAASASKPAPTSTPPGGAPAPVPEQPQAPASAASAPLPPALVGCARMGPRCTCYDGKGEPADKPAEFCDERTGRGLPEKQRSQVPEWLQQPGAATAETDQLVVDGEQMLDRRRQGLIAATLSSQ